MFLSLTESRQHDIEQCMKRNYKMYSSHNFITHLIYICMLLPQDLHLKHFKTIFYMQLSQPDQWLHD